MKNNPFLICILCLILGITTSCQNDDDKMKFVAMKLVDSNMWSIVNLETGEILFKDEFTHEPSVIFDGVFSVKNDEGLYDVFNIKDVKKPINKEPFKDITTFNIDGEALAVKPGGCIMLINKKCDVLKEFDKEIRECCLFSENGTTVFTDASGKKGLIDKNGNIIVKAKYDEIQNSSTDDEIIVSTKNGEITEYKIIDKKENVSFEFTSKDYDEIGYFNEGMLAVKKSGSDEVYFINKKGEKSNKIGTQKGYKLLEYVYVNGLTPFFEGESYGIKNKDGEIVIRAKYEELQIFDKSIIRAKKNGKWGIINENDETVLPFDYSALYHINKNRFINGEIFGGNDNNSFSIIDKDGKDIGKNNYKGISVIINSCVTSNFYDPKSEAQKIASMFTNSSCNNVVEGKTLNDFKHLLINSESYYKGDYTLYDSNKKAGVSIQYCFDSPIAKETYEYFWGYKFPNGAAFNYNSKCQAVELSYSLNEYPITAEEAFVKEFESILSKRGFIKNGEDNYFENSEGINVGVGYSEGEIKVRYCFGKSSKNKLIREARKPGEKFDSIDFVEVCDSDYVEIDTCAADTCAPY